MTPPEGIERARRFIVSNTWIFANKYADTAPHEYVVKAKMAGEEMKGDFEWFVMFIREHGYREEFWGKAHTYLNIDGKKYWTMGASLKETIIINRADL